MAPLFKSPTQAKQLACFCAEPRRKNDWVETQSFLVLRGRPDLNRQPLACTESIIFIMAWTISLPCLIKLDLGTLVSSLYGVPRHDIRVPSVFAYPSTSSGLSLHRYPKEFQSALSTESCTNLQASALTS